MKRHTTSVLVDREQAADAQRWDSMTARTASGSSGVMNGRTFLPTSRMSALDFQGRPGSKDAHTRGLDVPQIRPLPVSHPISWTVTSRMSRYANRFARPNGNE